MRLRRSAPLALALAAAATTATAQTFPVQTLAPQAIAADDLIGSACDISGTSAIIGGYGHDAGGVASTGGAWVFDRQAGGNWSEVASLQPSDGITGARFAWAVAIDGDVAMVGAYRDGSTVFFGGSVYVYERQGDGTWIEIQKLAPSDVASGYEFGHSISIDGDYAVIGTPGAFFEFDRPGAGYVFERQSDGTWLEVAKCTLDDNLDGDELGFDASISGTRVVLGAHLYDENGNSSGAAYVFERQGDGSWPNTGKLLASDGALSDRFGYSVAVSGDTIVSGAWLDDDYGSGTGSAYVYELQPDGSWLEAAKLLPGIEQSNGHFGQSVAIDGDFALIGAIHQIVTFQLDAGAAYGFHRQADGTWPLVQSYFYEDVDDDQNFGHCVAVDDGLVAIGSSDNDEFAGNAGLVEVFFTYDASDDPAPVVQGAGTAGCDGPQTIGLAAPAHIDSAGFGFVCDAAPANSTGFLLVGNVADIAGSDILGLGVTLHVNVLLSTPTLLLDFFSDASGNGFAPVPLPSSPSLVGAVLHAQAVWAWSSCSLPPLNLSSSNLVSFTISAP